VNEFPVERESSMFQIAGPEPAFNLPLRRRFPDAAKNMFDTLLLTVLVEA
jgi:hypothetical protein